MAILKRKEKSSLTILLPLSSFPPRNSLQNDYNNISLPWIVAFCLPKHLFCLTYCKTRWTMLMDNVGLEICLWGPWTPWSFWQFLFGVNQSGPLEQVQHPITYFTRSWDDLMIHGQWLGIFLGIITGWDPSVCKSNRLHVDILQISFIKLKHIL